MSIYRKDVRHLDEIDLYVLADLYDVKSHAVFHAIKKLICAGKRGAKDYEQDLMEAIESIERELQMMPALTEETAVEFDEQRIDAIVGEQRTYRQPGEIGEKARKIEVKVDPIKVETEFFDEKRIDNIGQNGECLEYYASNMFWHPTWGERPVGLYDSTTLNVLFHDGSRRPGTAGSLEWKNVVAYQLA